MSIRLEAEVDGRNSGIEGEDGMVGTGAKDLDHVLYALTRLTPTLFILIWTVPKCVPLTFPDPDPIRICRIRAFLGLLEPVPDSSINKQKKLL